MARSIRVAGASGFWGDSRIAVPQLLGEDIDYLTFDYLAEVTMAILARARARDAALGYAGDFVDEAMGAHLETIARRGIKVISNAGGVNPAACAAALEALIAKAGLDLKVAYVSGDDIVGRADQLRERDQREMFTGATFPQQLLSANAYLGAFPIAAALARGADIVVTGRIVDSAVTLGAAIHAFGWQAQDFDRLAGGSLAGHIIECGAQASGGIFTDWKLVPRWEDVSYPIVEIAETGDFIVTKPAGSGGLVSVGTVSEQLVYEIGDPRAYHLPDVTCDFADVRIEEIGADRVAVSRTKGRAPTDTVKVSATWQDGYRLGFYTTIVGREADGKARKMADAVWTRCAQMLAARNLAPFSETSDEIIGAETSYGAYRQIAGSREVILKLAAKHPERRGLELLLREATSGGCAMAVGTSGLQGHRPKPMPQINLFSFLLPKNEISPQVSIAGETLAVPFAAFPPAPAAAPAPAALPEPVSPGPDWRAVPLVALAWGRSGDKGDKANIGVIARAPAYFPYIAAQLTPAVVAERFAHFTSGKVVCFVLPGLPALNFLIDAALGGGGTASIRNDSQAKTFAQILLDTPLLVPPQVAQQALERLP